MSAWGSSANHFLWDYASSRVLMEVNLSFHLNNIYKWWHLFLNLLYTYLSLIGFSLIDFIPHAFIFWSSFLQIYIFIYLAWSKISFNVGLFDYMKVGNVVYCSKKKKTFRLLLYIRGVMFFSSFLSNAKKNLFSISSRSDFTFNLEWNFVLKLKWFRTHTQSFFKSKVFLHFHLFQLKT